MKPITYRHVCLIPTLIKEKDIVKPFSRLNVAVNFDPVRFGRKSSKNIDQVEIIESVWKAKSKNNQRMFNGSKFRLESMHFPQPGSLELRVGLTDYKQLQGTHYCSKVNELVQDAKLEFGDQDFFSSFSFMSNCIGVGAICRTSDNFIVLMKRSSWTGEGAGKIDRPGGHPEPEEVLKVVESTIKEDNLTEIKDSEVSSYLGLQPQDVLNEIFDSPSKELRDEINIELSAQEEPKLLGEILDMEHGGRVGLDFFIKVNLTGAQVLQRYQQGHQVEADESTELILISVDKVEAWNFDESFLEKMTPHCLGGLRLLHIFLKSDAS